jgi:hypothetical protein
MAGINQSNITQHLTAATQHLIAVQEAAKEASKAIKEEKATKEAKK